MRARIRLAAWAAAPSVLAACGSGTGTGSATGPSLAASPRYQVCPAAGGPGTGDSGGFGAPISAWSRSHQPVGGSTIDYGAMQSDGRYRFSVHCGPGARVLAVEVHFAPPVSLGEARRRVAELLPADAVQVADVVHSDKNCEQVQYRSASLEAAAGEAAPGGVIDVEYGSPPTTIGVYDPAQIGDAGIDTRTPLGQSSPC